MDDQQGQQTELDHIRRLLDEMAERRLGRPFDATETACYCRLLVRESEILARAAR